MSSYKRTLTALGLIAFGIVAWLLLRGQVVSCLGPIGVTAVECAIAAGFTAPDGIAQLVASVAFATAAFLLAPIPSSGRLAAAAAGAIGAAIGAVVYLTARPRVMEGPSSSGQWLSIELPPDGATLAAAAIALGTVGALACGHLVAKARAA